MKIATAGHWILYSNCSVSKRHSTVSCLLIVQKQCCFVPPVSHWFQTASRPVCSTEVLSSPSQKRVSCLREALLPQDAIQILHSAHSSDTAPLFPELSLELCLVFQEKQLVHFGKLSEVWFVVRFWLDFLQPCDRLPQTS